MIEWICITGASSGIGRAYALEEAKNGEALILTGRNEERLNETKQACLEQGAAQVETFVGDLTFGDIADDFVAFCTLSGQIKGFVHCAGFGDFSHILDQSEYGIWKLVDTNLLVTMFLAKRFAYEMLTQNVSNANITLISSVAAKLQTPKSAVYSATKAGVYAFANGLRQDLWPTQINVTCVLPGPTDTAFFEIADESGEYFNSVRLFSTNAETVARKMVQAIDNGQHEVMVPKYYDFLARFAGLMPALSNKFIHHLYDRTGFRDSRDFGDFADIRDVFED